MSTAVSATDRYGGERDPLPAGHVAIIGSGPAGYYAAQHMRKKWPQCSLTVIDQELTPYGLLRYGVAPDHQGTKSVQ